MPETAEKVRAPELTGGQWLGSAPLTMEGLRGAPVLIDFWDYTCVNCIRTLPYVKEWHRRYEPFGLRIIGVHAPEFTFARQQGANRAAIAVAHSIVVIIHALLTHGTTYVDLGSNYFDERDR